MKKERRVKCKVVEVEETPKILTVAIPINTSVDNSAPVLKTFTRMRSRHDHNRIGVFITGQLQKGYIQQHDHISIIGDYTIILESDPDSSGWTFNSLGNLLVNWEPIG